MLTVLDNTHAGFIYYNIDSGSPIKIKEIREDYIFYFDYLNYQFKSTLDTITPFALNIESVSRYFYDSHNDYLAGGRLHKWWKHTAFKAHFKLVYKTWNEVNGIVYRNDTADIKRISLDSFLTEFHKVIC